MALSDINKVRSYIGDNDKAAVNEMVAHGDGSTEVFKVDMFPIRTGTQTYFVSGVAVSAGVTNHLLGTFDFTGAGVTVPTAGAAIQASYQYNALSDDEIQDAIDVASGNGLMIAGAIAARKLAANFVRFFSYTQGDKTVDKRFIAKNLNDIAESLEKSHENAIKKGGMTVTVSTFDDSGTEFDGFDTAVAVYLTATT